MFNILEFKFKALDDNFKSFLGGLNYPEESQIDSEM